MPCGFATPRPGIATTMRLDWLREVCDRPGPFATVLLDATHDTADAGHSDELRRRGVVEDLGAQGAPEGVCRAVDAALAGAEPPAGAGGQVLVAGEHGVLFHALTSAPPPAPRSVWGPTADLLAVARAMREPVPTVVVRIDEAGGEVLAPGDRDVEHVSGADGPVHKVCTGGLSDLSIQERVEETWRSNTAEVAARVDERVRASGARLLVITGDGPARARLRDALPQRSASVVAEVEHSGGAGPADVPAAVAGAVDDLLDAERRAALAQYQQAVGRTEGLAVTGLAGVVAAARAAAIETLLIDPAALVDTTVWSGPEPAQLAVAREDLAAFGVEDTVQVDAVAALIRAAACTDAALVVLDDPAVVQGRDPLDDASPATEPTAGNDTGDGEPRPPEGVLAQGVLADGLGAVLRFPIGPAA